MKTSKFLVITGANGYLGQHTIKKAISEGWSVVGIVRREEAAKDIQLLGAKPIIIKDFNVESLKNAITKCRSIIHFRGAVCGSKEKFEKINVEGVQVIIDASKQIGVSRIIFPSGLGVDQYGKADWATNEYFNSKLRAEQKLKEGGVPFVIFRPSYILGPGDELIPNLIDQIGTGEVPIAGSGDIPMQPIYVEDAVAAFIAAAEGKGDDNKIYDLVGPETINMNNLVDLVVKNLKNLGFNIPFPRIKNISYNQALDQLELCKEMIDVMRCNVISNGNIAAKALDYKLSDLRKAINASVVAKMFPQEESGKKAIVLLSGGIDSATALYWAKQEGYNLIAISFNYNLRPESEKKAALKLTSNLGINIIEVPIEYLKEAIDLRVEGLPVPSAFNSPEGFIPVRNLVFYSLAAYYAEVYGCSYIIGGHIAVDSEKFPDASITFFKKLEKIINKSKHPKDHSINKIILPLINLTKVDVIKLANELGVPFEWTWSCYSDGEVPCGQCFNCIKRKEAFKELGFSDTLFSL
ncbi:MAG: 7-cyano-7-deazaguanine synthase [Promethearchaeota archaeon]